MKILIVEDFQSSAEYLSCILAEEQYITNIALTGKEALRLLSVAQYNLIILDLELPDMSGLDVLKSIRKIWNSSELPVVIVSSTTIKKEILKTIEYGANDFISKPFEIINLTLKIRNLLKLQTVNNQLKDKIAELEKSQQALQYKSEEINNFFTLTVDLLCIMEINGTFHRVNKAWEDFFGMSENEIFELNVWDYIHKDDIEITIKIINNIANGKTIPKFVNRCKSKTGEYRWIEWNSILYGENLIYSAARDITDRIQTEQQLELYAKELQQMNRDKDKFISILAHDLRNPFNTLMGFSNLLSRNVRKYSLEKIESQVKYIKSATEQTYYLLEDLLNWARLQAGKFPFEVAKIDLTQIISEIIPLLQASADVKSIKLTFSVNEDIKYAYADINMLKTILRNLITNSIKFTRIEGMIHVFVEKHERKAKISVIDNGLGIPSERIPFIFELSDNRSTNGTNNEPGSGLGLLVCKEFIEKQGGEIWIESEENGGSKFIFTLPSS